MFGAALLVCAMNALLRFLPGSSAVWILIAVAAVVAVLGPSPEARLATARRDLLCILLLTTLVLCWRLWPQLKMGALLPVEGTGNADELWYIFSADWLRLHSLAQPFTADPAYPMAAAAGVNIGQLPRIGAESMLVALSVVSGSALEHVYVVLFAVAAVMFCYAASMGFIEEEHRHWRFLPLALATVAVSPVALYIHGNGNFATMWGLVFLGGYYWNIRAALQERLSFGQIGAAAAFLAAILATYPEMLAIAVPASGVLYLQALARRRADWATALRTLVLCAALAAMLAPWALADTLRVLATGAAASQGANTIMPTLFHDLTAANFLLTLLTFDSNPVEKFGHFAPALISALLFAALLFAPRRIWLASLGLVVGCLLVLLAFWRQNYGYGGMKAIEFLALPAATILAVSVARAATVLRPDSGSAKGSAGSRLLAFCTMLAVASLAGIAYHRTVSFNSVGADFRLSPELAALSRLNTLLPPDAVVQVGPELGGAALMRSRWIAYILRDVALVYPPELQSGGYLYNLAADYPRRAATVTHILRARTPDSMPGDGAVFRNSAYEVLPLTAIPFTLGQGFHGHEGWGRWMAGTAELALRGSCARSLHISVDHRFGGVTGEDGLIVSANGASTMFKLVGGKGEIDFAVPAGSTSVTLRSAASAVAPAAIGGGDTRALSYAITRLSMPACAL